MKMKIALLMMIALFFLMGGMGCEKDEYSDYAEGYIVASFVADKVGKNGIAEGRTPIGYCILLEN